MSATLGAEGPRRLPAGLDGFAVAVLACYCAVVIFVTLRHEFWEDEVRAWSIAREAQSLPELFASLHNEGHPALWYVLLYGGTWLSPSSVVLPVTSLLVAAAAAGCLLLWSPFRRWQKVLFLCGILPLYEYSVVARNYGLTMLLLFCSCALYARRRERPLPLALALALLANASAHGAVIAGGFLIALAAELGMPGRTGPAAAGGRAAGRGQRLGALLIVGLGIAACVAQTWPDATSAILRPADLSAGRGMQALVQLLRHPGHAFFEAVWEGWPMASAAIIGLAAFALLDRPFLLAAFLGSVLGLSLFFDLAYPGGLRHQGLLVVLLAAVLWLLPASRAVVLPRRLGGAVAVLRQWVLPAAFAAVLAAHAGRAWRAIRFDLANEMTSAPAFARLLRERFPNAIVMGEPDDALESLPFYAPNRIYIPREGRFGTWTHFTSANAPVMSLGELVRIGARLRERTRQPVLLAFGHMFRGNRLLLYGHLNRRTFTWSDEDMELFKRETMVVASFTHANNENYRVYAFR